MRTILTIITLSYLMAGAVAQTLAPEVIWATPKSVRIKCVTGTPGRMVVEYGLTPTLGQSSTPEMRDRPSEDVTTHYVIVRDLQPDTTYYYRVRVTLQSGGEQTSDIRTFKTLRNFPRLFPTVRYGGYLLGSYGTGNHAEWNATHFDILGAYSDNGNSPLADVKAVNPNVPATVYDNITNALIINTPGLIYNQYNEWQDWCDARGLSYEHTALHIGRNTTYAITGLWDDRFLYGLVHNSGNYKGVNSSGYEYWPYYPGTITNTVGGCWFIGHAERFDYVRVTITTPAAGGYDGVWEYCSALDAEGWPSGWTALTILEDTTVVNGQKLAQSGYIRFVPPKPHTEWKRSMVFYRRDHGPRKGFMIRFRVTQSGTPPYVSAVRNEDWAPESGGYTTVPGWDSSWETNPANNGDPEYNPNPPSGKSARFKWWARIWYYNPSRMRYVVNTGNPYWRQFYVDRVTRMFSGPTLYDGWYCDNYTAPEMPSVSGGWGNVPIIEYGGGYSTTTYVIQTGEMMEELSKTLYQLGKFSEANSVVRIYDLGNKNLFYPELVPAALAPAFSLREMATRYYTPYLQFESWLAEFDYLSRRGYYNAYKHAYRKGTTSPPDNPTWDNWNRDKLMALAIYLLSKDMDNEWMFFGAWHLNARYGEANTTTNPGDVNVYWQAGIPKQKAYYVPAAMRDFGQPVSTIPEGAVQLDKAPPGVYYYPNDRYVYYRRYTKALVIYRVRTGDTYGDETARTFNLDGYYYILDSEGNLSSQPVNQVVLRNAEAAILIPAEAPPSQPNVQVTISVDKQNPKPLDVVTVMVTATNIGNGEARNVRITHNIPTGATYVRGSLKLNGSALPDPTDTTKIDVTVASIPVGGQAVVEFQMVIR